MIIRLLKIFGSHQCFHNRSRLSVQSTEQGSGVVNTLNQSPIEQTFDHRDLSVNRAVVVSPIEPVFNRRYKLVDKINGASTDQF